MQKKPHGTHQQPNSSPPEASTPLGQGHAAAKQVAEALKLADEALEQAHEAASSASWTAAAASRSAASALSAAAPTGLTGASASWSRDGTSGTAGWAKFGNVDALRLSLKIKIAGGWGVRAFSPA